jgi:dynein heavy chain, axonemal
VQETIEGRLEKRTKGVFAPAGGKRLVAFIDDLNMPQKSPFGFIPPLELLKLWADNGFWYDRAKCEVKEVKEMQLLAAMAPPGGGRNAFSQRVMSVFSMLCVTAPSDSQLRKIYGSLLSAHLMGFDDQIKPLGEQIAAASVELYRAVVRDLLPTPSKSHYLFNTRDLAKIVQGTMQSTKAYYDTKEAMLALWCHEAFRVIGDRMWDAADKAWLRRQLEERLSGVFSVSWGELFAPYGGDIPPFVNFMRQAEHPPFEPVSNLGTFKALLTEKLEDYAMEPGNCAMDLVLFKDALMHLCRISRILSQPRGNALLVGVGALCLLDNLQTCRCNWALQAVQRWAMPSWSGQAPCCRFSAGPCQLKSVVCSSGAESLESIAIGGTLITNVPELHQSECRQTKRRLATPRHCC